MPAPLPPHFPSAVQAKLQLRSFADGALRKELELPGPGSIGGFSGNHRHSDMFFTFTGFTEPGATFRCGAEAGLITIRRALRFLGTKQSTAH